MAGKSGPYALAATYHQRATKRHCAHSTGPLLNHLWRQSLFVLKYVPKDLQQKNPESSMTQKHSGCCHLSGHGKCVRTNELLHCYKICYLHKKHKKSANHRMPHRHTGRLKVWHRQCAKVTFFFNIEKSLTLLTSHSSVSASAISPWSSLLDPLTLIQD